MTTRALTKRQATRREPVQRRAKATVTAVLDAVVRVLQRHGLEGVTTNRIAEVAGVSIGSVYQYFPDKAAIFAALHDRHAEAIGRVIDRTVVEHAAAPFETVVRALVTELIDAHTADPAFHELMAAVPQGADGARALDLRLRAAMRLAITSRIPPKDLPRNLDRMLLVLPAIVDALVHAAVYRRPAGLSRTAARDEAVRAVMAYLRA